MSGSSQNPVPTSGRQRRKLAWHLGFKKCPACREKALIIVKGTVVCNYCGTHEPVPTSPGGQS